MTCSCEYDTKKHNARGCLKQVAFVGELEMTGIRTLSVWSGCSSNTSQRYLKRRTRQCLQTAKTLVVSSKYSS